MGAGKNPYLRYRIIHTCLKNRKKKYWSLKDIREELEYHDLAVNQRSIERDLESMRHDNRLRYHAPIAYDRKEKGYYYTDPDYRLEGSQFTCEDFAAVSRALLILLDQEYDDAAEKLELVCDKLAIVVERI